jgi:hypothetical protein
MSSDYLTVTIVFDYEIMLAPELDNKDANKI